MGLYQIKSKKNIGYFFIAFCLGISNLYALKFLSILFPILTFLTVKTIGWKKLKSSFHLSPPFFFLCLLIFLAVMSIFWTTNIHMTLKVIPAICLTLLCAILFIESLKKASPDFINAAYKIMICAGLILLCLILIQLLADSFHKGIIKPYNLRPFMMKPTGQILGLFTFVVCAFVWIKNTKLNSILAFLVLALCIYGTRCETGFYALILASFVFVLSYLMPFWITRLSMISSYTFLILSPLLFVYIFSPAYILNIKELYFIINKSLFHRFLSWEFYSTKFFEKPFIGWGLESSRYIITSPDIAEGYRKLIHPHNSSVQAYVELGIVGGILFALFFASLFWMVEKYVKDRLSVAVCNATITFGLIAGEVTHNLWRNYWLSMAALAAGMCILFLKAREAQQRAPNDHSKRTPTPR